MDELINQITQRTGISTDQARTTIQTVMGYLKDKLPAPVASQVEGYLSGQGQQQMGGVAGQMQQQMGNLGGMFGGSAQSNQGS